MGLRTELRYIYISDRIRKIVPASFSPGFGLLGLASNFKPRGGSVKAGSGE